ncbi:hypothetical protein G6O67_001544 [Ophiocordyceps sinensis]|uniref:Uncharacterized protein n=1 Tax=Ophiocordyceps sinensis TaxID=72228 RepID=A0A8H4PY35_9HYPO|nr:hypothetical protein G6O67_001544 [Ophiocordyceps sinensis]
MVEVQSTRPSQYSLVCKDWQPFFEMKLYRHLTLTQDSLYDFRRLVLSNRWPWGAGPLLDRKVDEEHALLNRKIDNLSRRMTVSLIQQAALRLSRRAEDSLATPRFTSPPIDHSENEEHDDSFSSIMPSKPRTPAGKFVQQPAKLPLSLTGLEGNVHHVEGDVAKNGLGLASMLAVLLEAVDTLTVGNVTPGDSEEIRGISTTHLQRRQRTKRSRASGEQQRNVSAARRIIAFAERE